MKRVPFYDAKLSPAQVARWGRHPIVRALQLSECRRECLLYESSENETHLLRAWRAMRVFKDAPAECLAWLAPQLDRWAAQSRNSKRADQLAKRTQILTRYRDLIEPPKVDGRKAWAPRTKTAARRQVAAELRTTDAAIKQMVLEHESRTERKRTPKKR